MLKKGELSLNIVVVAAIAMIVLVILSVLVFQAGGDIRGGMECGNIAQGGSGTCVDETYGCELYSRDVQGEYSRFAAGSCPDQQVCCVRSD